jgi:hypothetical protein
MQAIKTFAEIESEIEHLVLGLVYASPKQVIYEVDELFFDDVLGKLENYETTGIQKDGRSYVAVVL